MLYFKLAVLSAQNWGHSETGFGYVRVVITGCMPESHTYGGPAPCYE